MAAQRVLYVGGTGTISWSCVMRSVAAGADVCVLNRGMSGGRRALPPEVRALRADVRDRASVELALGGAEFDAVVNFLAFNAEHAAAAADIFRDRTGHYVHISTAALYHKPPKRLPYLESTARHNPYSSYAQDKIAAEDVLAERYDTHGFPVTVVRPSHTYDRAKPPIPGDWTVIDRLVADREIVVPGDGTSLWTLTHAEDFAVGLVGLLGNPVAVGETFHITSDFVYSWNQIYEILATAAGTRARLAHIPTEFLPRAAPDWRWTELIQGDLQHSVILDNSKIRAYVPEFAPRIDFHQAARDMLAWRLEHAEYAQPDPQVNAIIDRLLCGYHESARIFAALASRQPALS